MVLITASICVGRPGQPLPELVAETANGRRGGAFRADVLEHANVSCGWKTRTQQAHAQLPGRFAFQRESAFDRVQVGSPAVLRMGYEGHPGADSPAFAGYVDAIHPGDSIRLDLACAMTLANATRHTKVWRLVRLAKLVAELGFDDAATYDAQLHHVEAVSATPAQVLDALARRYGLHSWFEPWSATPNRLHVDSPHQRAAGRRHLLRLDRDVPSWGLGLEHVSESTNPIVVEAVNLDLAGGRAVRYIGADGVPSTTKPASGTIHTLNYLDQPNYVELATATRKRLAFTGYRGNLTVFGAAPLGDPQTGPIHHGDVVELLDPNRPELNGAYHVDAHTLGLKPGNGYTRTITLGPRVLQ